MAIFISYNHSDGDFAENLALNLTRLRHSIWIDKWELNAGDSLVEKIQNEISESDAIIVILSKNSIESSWCKKELNAGLMREMDEKRVIIIACKIDDCKVPIFLREKIYVDFQRDRDAAMSLLDRSLRRISNPNQSRTEAPHFHTDWSVDWGDVNGNPVVEWTFVEHGINIEYCIVIRCRLIPNSKNTINRYLSLTPAESHLAFCAKMLNFFLEKTKNGDYQITIQDHRNISETSEVLTKNGDSAIIHIDVRRIGTDTGFDTLVRLDNIIKSSTDHIIRIEDERQKKRDGF